MTPVIHRKCGTQVGWYLRETPREPDRMLSADFAFMDGSRPKFASRISCPACGLIQAQDLKRIFKPTPSQPSLSAPELS
jgi:hypothetical protein